MQTMTRVAPRRINPTFAAPKALVGRSSIAPVLLFMLILAISVGPRISLGFVDGEIRVQDLLLLPILVYLVGSRRPQTRKPIYKLLGPMLPVFLWSSCIVVLVSIIVHPQISEARRVLFYGRTIEMFVLAAAVAGLYVRSGKNALNIVTTAVAIGAMLNLAWVGYQVAIEQTTTLFGQEFAETTGHYGPMLIGEPTAFGVGQYWAFVAAVSAAHIKARKQTGLYMLLLVGAFFGAWVAESRVSVGSIIIIAGLILILGRDRKRSANFLGIIVGVVAAFMGSMFIFPDVAEGRLSPDEVVRSFLLRVEHIWVPLMSEAMETPLVGVGPGGITGSTYLSEGHNVIVRAFLDFGVIVGPMFVLIFVIALFKGFRFARTPDIDPTSRVAGYIAGFYVLSTLVSGQVQDSLTAVMSSHLTMLAIGVMAAQRAIHLDSPELSEQPVEGNKTVERTSKKRRARRVLVK